MTWFAHNIRRHYIKKKIVTVYYGFLTICLKVTSCDSWHSVKNWHVWRRILLPGFTFVLKVFCITFFKLKVTSWQWWWAFVSYTEFKYMFNIHTTYSLQSFCSSKYAITIFIFIFTFQLTITEVVFDIFPHNLVCLFSIFIGSWLRRRLGQVLHFVLTFQCNFILLQLFVHRPEDVMFLKICWWLSQSLDMI